MKNVILERFERAHETPSDEDRLRIELGSMRDYNSLAAFHYKASRPGATTTVYRLVHETQTVVGRFFSRRDERQIAGVLLRSLPHLACAMRDFATRGRYAGFTASAKAMLLNRELRTISRIVIHPQWRGVGLAVRLVRHALANPEPGQRLTEALAAMGRVHPFLERAGMARYDQPTPPAHQRLLDALARLEMPPWMLASPARFMQQLAELDDYTQIWFEHELARWHATAARRKRGSSRRRDASLYDMLHAASTQVLATPVYYLFAHAP